MTIDEVIARERKMAEIHRNNIVPKENYHNMPWIDKNNEASMRSAEEHEQIAEWLEELKDYQDKNKMVVRIDCANSEQFKDIAVKLAKEQYNKAIDDCKELTFREVVYYDSLNDRTEFRELAEQLKAGGENE